MFLHWHILLYPKVLKLISVMSSCLHLQIDRPKKLLILNVNGLLCYFLHSTIWHENAWVFGKKIDMSKMEVEIRMQHFLSQTFKYFYIVIWSCMKLEDVLKVLPMLMPEYFLERSVFIWGCEQCSKMFGQIPPRSHYYLKHLKWVYYACLGLPHGKEDQTLWRRFGIWSGVVFFLNHSRDKCSQRIKCNGRTSHHVCGHCCLNCL
jgi:hypothetical protein